MTHVTSSQFLFDFLIQYIFPAGKWFDNLRVSIRGN